METNNLTLKHTREYKGGVRIVKGLYGERILITLHNSSEVQIVDSNGKMTEWNFHPEWYCDLSPMQIMEVEYYPSFHSDLILIYHESYGLLGMDSRTNLQFRLPLSCNEIVDDFITSHPIPTLSIDPTPLDSSESEFDSPSSFTMISGVPHGVKITEGYDRLSKYYFNVDHLTKDYFLTQHHLSSLNKHHLHKIRLYNRETLLWEKNYNDILNSHPPTLSSDGQALFFSLSGFGSSWTLLAIDLLTGNSLAQYDVDSTWQNIFKLLDYSSGSFLLFNPSTGDHVVASRPFLEGYYDSWGEEEEGEEEEGKEMKKVWEPIYQLLLPHLKDRVLTRGRLERDDSQEGEVLFIAEVEEENLPEHSKYLYDQRGTYSFSQEGTHEIMVFSYNLEKKIITSSLTFDWKPWHYIANFDHSLFLLKKVEITNMNSMFHSEHELHIFSKSPLFWSPSEHVHFPTSQQERYYQIFLILSLSPLSQLLPQELICEIISLIPLNDDQVQ